jgi:phospholipid/cholesterol/gamma-HCH transport system substrate-binding protein
MRLCDDANGEGRPLLGLDFILTAMMFNSDDFKKNLWDRPFPVIAGRALSQPFAKVLMQRSKIDAWVGLFVMVGAAAILFLALQAANLLNPELSAHLPDQAEFDTGGLRQGVGWRGGVVVGRIEDISFNDQTFQAVTIDMQSRYVFSQGQLAENPTSGLLGEQYTACQAGGNEEKTSPRRYHPANTVGRGA